MFEKLKDLMKTPHLKDDKTKEPKTSVNGHVEYVRFSSDSKKDDETFTIKFGGFSVHGTGWYILAKAGGGLSWQLKGEWVFFIRV